jgi:hypothetical protein
MRSPIGSPLASLFFFGPPPFEPWRVARVWRPPATSAGRDRRALGGPPTRQAAPTLATPGRLATCPDRLSWDALTHRRKRREGRRAAERRGSPRSLTILDDLDIGRQLLRAHWG